MTVFVMASPNDLPLALLARWGRQPRVLRVELVKLVSPADVDVRKNKHPAQVGPSDWS